MSKKPPKLKTVNKSEPPFKLNDFSKDFHYEIGKDIIYILATKSKPTIEGSEWEAIFARAIGAKWKPSNVGLDDVVLGNTAWGAKTVKAKQPSNAKKVRLISGRNSIVYSFGEKIDVNVKPDIPGSQVLDIWNERVSSIREKFKNLRTVVLIKSDDLCELVVFEFETIRYDPELYYWKWNKNHNLQGFDKKTGNHRFTWQPHGSQFTIIEEVPNNSTIIRVKNKPQLEKEAILQSIGFDKNWIEIKKTIR